MSHYSADELFPSDAEVATVSNVSQKNKSMALKRKAAPSMSCLDEPLASSTQQLSPASLSTTTAGKASRATSMKRQKKVQPPVTVEELFGSDSDENEELTPHPRADEKPSMALTSATQQLSPASLSTTTAGKASRATSVKRQKKVTIHPISPCMMRPPVTTEELFGSDSDENEELTQRPRAVTSHKTVADSDHQMIECCECSIKITKKAYKNHLRTNLHKSNCLLRTEFENVDIMGTAFKNRIVTYRMNPAKEVEYLSIEAFLWDVQTTVIKLIKLSMMKNNCIKVNMELFARFVLPTSEQELKSFNTKYDIIYQSTDLNEFYMKIFDILKTKVTEFNHCKSGWSYLSVSHLEININKYCPLRGGSYIKLPSVIENTKSCINIKNYDNCCFAWSVLAALVPAKNNVCKVSSYPHFSEVFDTENILFPPSFQDIKVFETINPYISINVYGLDERNNVTGPLYRSKQRKQNHVNLLFIEKNNQSHYCLIKDLKRLIKRQVTKSHAKLILCEGCLQFFSSESKYTKHMCSEMLEVLPDENSKIKFKKFERKQKINFVIYADFECLLINRKILQTENTEIYKKHEPSCFAYFLCCSHDSNLNKFVSYRGIDCVKVFVKSLLDDVCEIQEILNKPKRMKPLTKEQMKDFEEATKCHICNNFLFGDKIMEHDHLTSEYRGAAHSNCNLLYRTCKFIPIVFHGLSNYDSHLFIKELAKYDGQLYVIPKTKEKYISISKTFRNYEGHKNIEIKFIDSFQFLSSSLDELSKSLSVEEFKHLSNAFPEKTKFDLIRQKGIYPYDYMDSWDKYKETKLPEKSFFYNTLKSENITNEEYERAQNIWLEFNVTCLGEYTDLYLKCDVLLLCDIYENLRNTSLQYFQLDPAWYVSSPGLSWDSMLLHSEVQLDLIHDLEMYQMIEKGIRGGLSQCSTRYGKANNIYLPEYNDLEPTSYLIYFDCVNLYGYTMMKKLPISDFRFLSESEMKIFDVTCTSDDGWKGYILEVDLEYPDYLHNYHNDLPFAPEKFIPPGGKTEKLIASLYNKYNYVIHFVHLKECIKQGLILKNVHRVLEFTQDSFLKSYIELNTALRKASKSAFQKDFFKLLINAIFGKTIENKRKQVDVKLVSKWNDDSNRTNKMYGAEKLIAKPNVKHVSIYSENLVAIQLIREKICLDRPIYVGFAVLELAKTHLYQFHYNFIKKLYQEQAKLCYTDTDSLLYLIHSENVYKDLKHNISCFDTSNYKDNNPFDIPQLNAKIPGLFKDEMGGDVISEYIGLRAKLYYLSTVKTKIIKAKGIPKSVTNSLSLNDYEECLRKRKELRRKFNLIRSLKHELYSQSVNKLVLNCADDKRQVGSDKVNTFAWGHCETIF